MRPHGGEAGQRGQGRVEAGVATPHLGLSVARDVTENMEILYLHILSTSFSSDNCLSAIPKQFAVLTEALIVQNKCCTTICALSYLCLRERGTATAFSGGNLSLFLETDSSSLDMETYCES